MEQQTMKIQDLTLIALMAALTCIFRTNVDHIAIYTSTDFIYELGDLFCSNGYWDETWNDQLSCIPSDRSSRTSSIFRI